MTSITSRITLLASSLIIASFLTACGEQTPNNNKSTEATSTPTPTVASNSNSDTTENTTKDPVVNDKQSTTQEPKVTAKATTKKDIFSGYTTQKIAAHTYVIHGPLGLPNPRNQGFMNNPGFIVTNKSVIVIDPGSSLHTGQALVARIKDITPNPVTHVFTTHVHGDHWLGNHGIKETYPNAAFYAHPNMIEQANNGDAEMWIKTMHNLTKGATEGTKAIIPDQASNHEETIKVDNITVKPHFIEKAHSDTDLMLEIVEDKVLFTGDNITYTRIPRMQDGTFKGSIAAADHALALPIEHVVPGHGPSGGKEVLQAYRDYLSIVYEKTKALMEEDLESFEMKPKVIEQLPNHKNWSGFEEQIGKHIGLSVLEIESDF